MSRASLTPKQRELLKMKIKRVRMDAKVQEDLEKIPFDILVENYIEMSVAVIREMEARTDPVFVEVLNYAKSHLTREEFRSIQIEIYAACNKIAMQQCTPVDHIAHLARFTEPPE